MTKAYALRMKRLDDIFLSGSKVFYLLNNGNSWIQKSQMESDDISRILFFGPKGKDYLLKQAENPSKDESFMIETYNIARIGIRPVYTSFLKKASKNGKKVQKS